MNKLRELEEQIAALGRQTKYPFVVSHGAGFPDFQIVPDPNDPDGNAQVVIGNGAGGVVLETFYSTVYNGKAARMLDLNGTVMWAHDELAGYGLSHPSMSFATGPASDGFGAAAIANNTETVIGQGWTFCYNPALRLKAFVRPSSTTTYNFRWQVNHPDGTIFSPLVTGLTGGQFCAATILLPETAMANEVKALLLVTNTGGAQSFYYGHDEAVGVSMAQYNLDNGIPIP
ncbi:hypothetical protein AB0383_19700 [Amycolatopsis sp. NPDC051373]|uniref:hypothetical protein n=1 Tax=Amycolatopsis sp. NPDC051373 TaxID=3155801 RepID=UPI00344B4424